MNDLTGWGIAAAAALVLTGLAYAVRARVCRPMADATTAGQVTLLSLLGLIVPAAVVLLLTVPLLAGARWHAGFDAWLDAHAIYLRAWFAFWWLVLLIEACEFALRFVYALRGRPFAVPMLVRNIVVFFLMVVALLVVAQSVLGYDISTALASTALLTAVAGFALQGVLGNLMAGISMHIVRSMMPGDWVAIGDVEGEVLATNWRETRLRTVGGHILILPNSKVSEAVIHNMTRPTPLRRIRISVGASYSDAPGEVKAALEAAALSVPAVLREPRPSALVSEYKDFGINYDLRFWTNQYFDRAVLIGDVQARIWYQFKRQNIEIPFPMSDKLLNDFMEVVYHQRTLPPEEEQVDRDLADLQQSDFYRKFLVDAEGHALVTEAEMRPVARAMQRVRYTQGETLFAQGESGETAYVILHGSVLGRVEFEADVAPHRFMLEVGALFGEMSLVTGMPRTATLTATGEVELLEVPKAAFVHLLELRPDIPVKLAALVAQRAAENAAMYVELKAMPKAGLMESLKQDTILQRFKRMLAR
jgi:small-conductance mechanosensitive channel/CRP-like cAMP-binding protein